MNHIVYFKKPKKKILKISYFSAFLLLDLSGSCVHSYSNSNTQIRLLKQLKFVYNKIQFKYRIKEEEEEIEIERESDGYLRETMRQDDFDFIWLSATTAVEIRIQLFGTTKSYFIYFTYIHIGSSGSILVFNTIK